MVDHGTILRRRRLTFLREITHPFQTYAHWLHLNWPADVPEALPEVGPNGATAIPGIRIAGDLLGIPLLKFAADSGSKTVQEFFAEGAFAKKTTDALDLAIIGGGVAGLSAALEAQKRGLNFKVYEAAEAFSTIVNFTNNKPIFTYPTQMKPAGDLKLSADVKEDLLTELRTQAEAADIPFEIQRVDRIDRKGAVLGVLFDDGTRIKAKRVLLCTGKSGDHRTMNVPGEHLDKVHNRLFDPHDYRGQNVLVVGGGDSALESANSLVEAGAHVTLSYRGQEFSRPKRENREKAQALGVNSLFETQVKEIKPDSVELNGPSGDVELPNEAVFVMIGRQAPVEFLRRCGINMSGHWTIGKIASFITAFLAVVLIYRWKTQNSELADLFLMNGWFPYNIDWYEWADTNLFARALQDHVGTPGFYYELIYTLIIILFGIRRVKRNPTPYIRRQTLSLVLFQLVPLFLLPYLILPLMGELGAFNSGAGAWTADQLFPMNDAGIREYWRAVGFILAWPLFIWNVFTPSPNLLWLSIALLQTFVIIPWLVYRYGKGAYCGWICSCGALAETLGDAHRAKMPHGSGWNKLNLAGQFILGIVFLLLLLRLASWVFPDSTLGEGSDYLFAQMAYGFSFFGIPLNYSIIVDYFLAGILGLGLYFHFSGRTWCRFFCPLAALMHIYARFSKFRIFSDKNKCISCNACTTVCHQGIDVMNFANKGLPMEDPQCVRCSACVQTCPTGVLSFGTINKTGEIVLDKLPASPVQIRE